MSFRCPEFPGLTFSSLEELRVIRMARNSLKKKLSEPVVVTVKKE